MTPIQRGILILLASFISVIIIAYQAKKKSTKDKQAYTYLMCLSALFPLLDLSMERFGIRISVFNCATLAYLLLNFNNVIQIFKKFYIIIILIIVMIISSFCSDFTIDSLLSIPDRLKGFVVFAAVVIIFEKNNNLDAFNLLNIFFKYPIFFTIIWGIIQITIDPFFSLYYNVWNKEVRISTCFPDPQIAGCAAAIFAIFIWQKYNRRFKISNLITILTLLVIGASTGSKAFLLGFLAAFLVSTIYSRQKGVMTLIITFISFILVITYNYWIELSVFSRLNEFSESMGSRQNVYWFHAIAIFTTNWFSGIGTGVFQKYIEKYNIPLTHKTNDDIIYVTQPESGYLLWLDELGIFSIVWLIILLVMIIKYRGNNVINTSLLTPWLIAFVSLYNLQSSMLTYILFVSAAAIIYSSKNKQSIVASNTP